jgi:hypothetical protein
MGGFPLSRFRHGFLGLLVFFFILQVFDYNTLESAFLISATFMLLGGLIFKSVSSSKGTPAYVFLSAFVAILFLSSVILFVGLLSYEMYQALKYAHVLQYVCGAAFPCCCRWSLGEVMRMRFRYWRCPKWV